MDFTTDDLRALFDAFATRMASERDALCALDGAIGDGDHGIAMEQGMRAAAAATRTTDSTLQDIFNAAAGAFLNAVGASTGPLYATALMRAAKAAGPLPAMPRPTVPTATAGQHRQRLRSRACHPANRRKIPKRMYGCCTDAVQLEYGLNTVEIVRFQSVGSFVPVP